MKVSLVVESDDAEIRITPKNGADLGGAGNAAGPGPAAPNWSRLAQMAMCVVSCMATPTNASAGEQLVDRGGQQQPQPGEQLPPLSGGPRNNPPRPR